MADITKTHAISPDRCELICMAGLPYSGKSTEAERLSKRWFAPIVCPDAIRVALHGRKFIGEAEPYVWAIAKTMVRSLFLTGHDRVILDATNITEARRNEWRSRNWVTHFVSVDTPVEECKRRAKEAGDEVMLDIIDKMAEEWEDLE